MRNDTNGLPQAAGRIADAVNYVARALGTGDALAPGGLELVAQALRDGLSDVASALEQIAAALRERDYSG